MIIQAGVPINPKQQIRRAVARRVRELETSAQIVIKSWQDVQLLTTKIKALAQISKDLKITIEYKNQLLVPREMFDTIKALNPNAMILVQDTEPVQDIANSEEPVVRRGRPKKL